MGTICPTHRRWMNVSATFLGVTLLALGLILGVFGSVKYPKERRWREVRTLLAPFTRPSIVPVP